MKQYIENTTENTIYVHGKSIGPGEGREVDVPDVQEGVAFEAVDEDAPLRELLDGTVAAVTESLPDLSLDTLDRLTALEEAADKPRKGVLSALEEARLALADAKLTSDTL